MVSKIYLCLISSVLLSLVFMLVVIFSAAPKLTVLFPIYVLIILIHGLLFFLVTQYAKSKHVEPVVVPVTTETMPQLTTTQTTAISPETQEKLRYDALLASIGEGLVVNDKTGKIISYNKAAEKMLGWTEEEALGKNLHEIMKVDYKNTLYAQKNHVGNPKALFFVRKDKTMFPGAITTTSYVSGNNILGTITLIRDITNEQNTDRMKNEFISLASHQLRTPLAAIKWYTEMLINGDGGKLSIGQSEYANNIYNATMRMTDLVSSMLNISRIESGRLIVEPKPTDVKNFVEEIVKEVTIRYEKKQQKITLHVDNSVPLVNFDPRLIRQVYLNLLTNACKYTPDKGEITIRISMKDDNLISEVKDTGYGIPAAEQDKIFDQFYRASNVLAKENDGTGIGLYFIKTIVEISKGKIWFESTENKGTTFYFTLPIAGTEEQNGVVTIDS